METLLGHGFDSHRLHHSWRHSYLFLSCHRTPSYQRLNQRSFRELLLYITWNHVKFPPLYAICMRAVYASATRIQVCVLVPDARHVNTDTFASLEKWWKPACWSEACCSESHTTRIQESVSVLFPKTRFFEVELQSRFYDFSWLYNDSISHTP